MLALGWYLSAFGLTESFSIVAALPGEMFTTQKGASSIAGVIEGPPVTSVVWG